MKVNCIGNMNKLHVVHGKNSKSRWFFTVLFFLLSFRLTSANSTVSRRQRLETLRTHLKRNYSVNYAPFQEAGEKFPVVLHYSLLSILGLDAADQVLNTQVYFGVTWTDSDLTWNATEEGSPGEGIFSMEFRSGDIWTPRLMIVNLADDSQQVMATYAGVTVLPHGLCIAQVPLRLSTTCKMDVTVYPFDTQECEVIFTPLIGTNLNLTGNVLNLNLSENTLDTSGEWEIEDITAVKDTVHFPAYGCSVEYVIFTLKLHRRHWFYVMTVLFPMAILSVTGACGFLLPLQCGEKVSFQVAIMVSLSVFLSFINDSMPKTSTTTSRLALYLDLLLMQSCLSLLATLTVLRGHYHLEKPDQQDKEQRMVTASTPGPQDMVKESTNTSDEHGGWQTIKCRAKRIHGWLRQISTCCRRLCYLPPRHLDMFFFFLFLSVSVCGPFVFLM